MQPPTRQRTRIGVAPRPKGTAGSGKRNTRDAELSMSTENWGEIGRHNVAHPSTNCPPAAHLRVQRLAGHPVSEDPSRIALVGRGVTATPHLPHPGDRATRRRTPRHLGGLIPRAGDRRWSGDQWSTPRPRPVGVPNGQPEAPVRGDTGDPGGEFRGNLSAGGVVQPLWILCSA
jgi:hypothetical protein